MMNREDAIESVAQAIRDDSSLQEYVSKATRDKLGIASDADVSENDDYWREYSIQASEIANEAAKKVF